MFKPMMFIRKAQIRRGQSCLASCFLSQGTVRRFFALCLTVCLTFSILPQLRPVSAQQDDATSNTADANTQDESNASDETADQNKAKPEIKERTIYIPFEKLRDVFEKDNRKVVLSYKEFNQLWKAAQANAEPRPAAETKRGSIISQAESIAEIKDSVVTVESTLKIELLSRGWSEVPIGLRNSAISSATIGDEDAKIIFDANAGYKLLARNDSDTPKKLELKLKFARAFQKNLGQSSVSFLAPQAPVNRWRIRIPQPQVKIDVTPLIAVTKPTAKKTGDEKQEVEETSDEETSDEPSENDDEFDPAKETVIYAFLGVAPNVTLTWNPKSEGASGLAAIVSAQTTQQVIVDKNVQRTTAQINYEISRAELSTLKIEVPADQKVTNVFNANVKKWDVETKDGKQIINVELFSPIKGMQLLAIELEKLTEEALKQDFSAAVINALDASRQQGVVVLKLAEGLRSNATNRVGLLQLDKSELPSQLSRTNWNLAYRYASLPYKLELSVEKILPRIVAEQMIEVDVTPQKISATMQVVYDIQQAGVFSTNLKIPDGFEVRSITGYTNSKQVSAAQVNEYRKSETDKSFWSVDFSRKALGKIGLLVQIEKELTDPNLLTPTGETSVLDLPFPQASDEYIEYSAGSTIVYGPVSLRINPESITGLQQATTEKAVEKIAARGPQTPSMQRVLSYTFSGTPSLSINVLRRKPQVTTRQLVTAKIESGVVTYDAKFYFDVLYSGVKNFRIDLPDSVAATARNLTSGVTESEIDAAENVPLGYVAWGFTGDSEFFGTQMIHLNWKQTIDELEIGKSVDIQFPRLIPQDVDRAQGQIVTSKSETIDIQPIDGVEGLVPIDPKVDLMPEAKVTDAAVAFEFVDQWKLGIRATRYDVEDVKLTNVEAGLVQMVKLRQSGMNVRALFRIRSAVQRLGMKLPTGVDPSDAFDSQPVRINGNPINLELGNDDELFIPLTGISTDEPFLLDLRYKVNAEASRMVLPTFADDPAMQKVFLCVYVPQEQAVVGSDGPWTNELLKDKTPGQILFEGSFNEFYTEQQIRDRIEEIKNDVKAGVSNVAVAPEFTTDGRGFLFSSLRPDPEQELQVFSVSKWWISVGLIGMVFVIGLPLYRRHLTFQLAALFLIIAIVVMTGVFYPMLARQILNSVLFISLGLIILVWAIGHAANFSASMRRAWSRALEPEPVSFEAVGDSPPIRSTPTSDSNESNRGPTQDASNSESATQSDSNESNQ